VVCAERSGCTNHDSSVVMVERVVMLPSPIYSFIIFFSYACKASITLFFISYSLCLRSKHYNPFIIFRFDILFFFMLAQQASQYFLSPTTFQSVHSLLMLAQQASLFIFFLSPKSFIYACAASISIHLFSYINI
jgi:hypothetical protein